MKLSTVLAYTACSALLSKACREGDTQMMSRMNDSTTEVGDLRNKTQAELLEIVNAYTEKFGDPREIYDGEKNTIFGWTDDGDGV